VATTVAPDEGVRGAGVGTDGALVVEISRASVSLTQVDMLLTFLPVFKVGRRWPCHDQPRGPVPFVVGVFGSLPATGDAGRLDALLRDLTATAPHTHICLLCPQEQIASVRGRLGDGAARIIGIEIGQQPGMRSAGDTLFLEAPAAGRDQEEYILEFIRLHAQWLVVLEGQEPTDAGRRATVERMVDRYVHGVGAKSSGVEASLNLEPFGLVSRWGSGPAPAWITREGATSGLVHEGQVAMEVLRARLQRTDRLNADLQATRCHRPQSISQSIAWLVGAEGEGGALASMPLPGVRHG